MYLDNLRSQGVNLISEPSGPLPKLDPEKKYQLYVAGYPPMLHYIAQPVHQLTQTEQQPNWKTKLSYVTGQVPQLSTKSEMGHSSLIRRNLSIPTDQPQ